MRLSDVQKQKLQSQLSAIRFACASCKNNSFLISDRLFEIREFNAGNLVIGGDSTLLPLVILTCEKCGHTIMLNAIKLGIVDSEKVFKDGSEK
jgi:RNase P subunit RPR2